MSTFQNLTPTALEVVHAVVHAALHHTACRHSEAIPSSAARLWAMYDDVHAALKLLPEQLNSDELYIKA